MIDRGIFNYLHNVKEAVSIEEVAKIAGLDFKVQKAQLYYDWKGSQYGVPNDVGIIRDNGVHLGTRSNDYGIIQYIDTLRFSETLVTKGKARYLRAAALGKGEQAIVVMKTDDFVNFGALNVSCYFYMIASHNGSKALTIVPSPYVGNRTVVAPPNNYKIVIKHTKHVINRMAQAQRSILKVQDCWDHFRETFERLAKIQLTHAQATEYFEMLLPGESTRTQNIRDDLEKLRHNASSCKLPSTKGTLLGAYLSVLEYVDIHKNTRKSKHLDPVSAKIASVLDGSGAKQKAEAYSFALKLEKKFAHF